MINRQKKIYKVKQNFAWDNKIALSKGEKINGRHVQNGEHFSDQSSEWYGV